MKKESSLKVAPTFRLVGILGGMGPAATVDLMQKVIDATPATRDQEHVPLIVWNVPQIHDRVAAIQDSNAPSPAPEMCRGAIALTRAGVEAIAIACNTAHFWAGEIEAALQETGVPLIHIADTALAQLAHEGRTMLLATEGTIQSGIYSSRAAKLGLELQIPDSAMQQAINQGIADIKRNNIPVAQKLLAPYLQSAQAAGVTTFLLGCTELPLAIRGTPFEAKSLDATETLARAIVAFSRGLLTK
jgi:aspartate racemase